MTAMNDGTDSLCNLCRKAKPLNRAIWRLYTPDGWMEETVMACQDCIDLECMQKSEEAEAKKVSKAAKGQKAA